jgi:hypothetical protein
LLIGAESLAVAPDGRTLYVGEPRQIRGFNLDASGGLHAITGALGCARTSGRGCTRARALNALNFVSVSVSGDGRNVYATGSGLAAFARVTAERG